MRVVILGGGYAGAHAANALEKKLGGREGVEVALVNKERYLVASPLLADVVSGDLEARDVVTPLRRLAPKTRLLVGNLTSVDLDEKTAALAPALSPREVTVEWDRLIVALGTIPALSARPGFAEHGMPFSTLADAIALRNHVIRVLEQAAIEEDPATRATLLRFVVSGGGYPGTQLAASLNDFLRAAVATFRPALSTREIRVVLVHDGEHVLEREVSPGLARYATRTLISSGVEVASGVRADAATPDGIVLSDGRRIAARTFLVTAPSVTSPAVSSLDLPLEDGRFRVGPSLQVEGREDVWAIGDCAAVPLPGSGGLCPPTAQYATRQAELAAENVLASLDGRPQRTFAFTEPGRVGVLGRRRAVAELPGGVRFSGLPAWLAWRANHWSKLPGIDRKLKVGASWLMNLLVRKEIADPTPEGPSVVGREHHQAGDIVFQQGDLGDQLYIIISGKVEVMRETGVAAERLAVLEPGEYFGEMALLGRGVRAATVRCLAETQLLTLPASEFGALMEGVPGFRREVEEVAALRARRHNVEGHDPF
jgi:NADH dehydrogenase